ncbi:MAG: hypothetical protein FJ253_12630 [Phycisphaerae bacterium]|nr:hypothetical protein [Phycisphaerae bacterium]
MMPVPGILGAARGGASAHGAAPRDDAEFNRMIGRRGTEPAILVDITGCELVHCGDASLAARVLRDLHRRGIHAQVAIASTQRAALAASIAWPCRVVPADRAESLELLSPLPLWTLRLSADLVDSLREINVTRIGHALMLPRGGAADRFGPELRHALDAMRGECVEDFHPLPHAAPIECELAFDGATTQPEAIELAVVQLLDRFCLRLARRQRGVRLLELSLDRIDALPIVERLTLGRPSRRAKHLWTLLRPRLERVNLGYGVEGVRLRSLLDAPLSLEQGRWSAADAGRAGAEHGEDDRAVAEMIDQFRSRLGHESISRFGYESISRLEHGAAWKSSDDSRAIEPYRPTVVFSKALSAEVTAEHLGTPDAAPRAMRPMAVRWAGGGGRVLECDGPERHAPRWWMGASGHRGGNGNGNGNRDHAGSGGVDRGESGGVDRGESGGVDRGGVGGEEDDRWRVRTDDGRWLWLLHHGGERWSVIGVWA